MHNELFSIGPFTVYGYGLMIAIGIFSAYCLAEYRARKMASEEGIFCGLSSACACEVALNLSETVDQAVIVFMMADRGNKYFSSGFFPF